MMEKKITCIVPFADNDSTESTVASLMQSEIVSEIVVVTGKEESFSPERPGISVLKAEGFASAGSLRKISEMSSAGFILLYTRRSPLDFGEYALRRMLQVCEDTGAGMVYSGYYENNNGELSAHPVIEYQKGALRDDFDFGCVLLFRGEAFREACSRMSADYRFAGLYDLRLKVSQKNSLVHLPELLYTVVGTDTRKSGEKQFDYVDPRNRVVQIEMEAACTDHLKEINGWLKPEFKPVDFYSHDFDFEASVIIPVRNRAKTIGDAINSVTNQVTDFKYNLIIIDNHSTDGTTEIIASHCKKDSRIIHIIPERRDLGIGGCWNKGIFNTYCGRFAIQLDSDDLYIDNNVLSRIVKAFYDQQCAMVVGSYKMVNFKLEEIPPGLIDHREWTPDNGRNNALRINGLGAPRAFFTPVLREIRVPNVSYGEDYAVGLAISRHYQIGRIYEPLYLCRRWDENSDASLDIHRVNSYNFYKDKIRTIELVAREKLVSNKAR
jgi:hypothetical protein